MIKELFLAIILGALLGFGITGGFFALQKNKSASVTVSSAPTTTVSTPIPTPTTINNNFTDSNSSLTISSPKDNSLVSNSKISITGSTSANSIVVITTLSKTYNVVSDNSGNFTTNIDLESGINQLHITSIDNNDLQTELQLSVTYSTAKI